MNTLQVIVVVDFGPDPDERHTRTWKRISGSVVERLLDVPEPVLACGNLLEVTLDGKLRELRIEALRWSEAKHMLRVRTQPTEPLAASLQAEGIKSWRPWVARRCAAEFLNRCRASGWRLAGSGEEVVAGPAPVVERRSGDRKEPTL